MSALLLCLAFAGSAQAQYRFFKEDPQVFYGGIAVGMNMCQVDGDGYGGYNKVGLNVGPVVYAQFSPKAGISLELLYSQKGARAASESYSYSLGQYFQQYYLKLNYVEIPVLFNFGTQHKLHGSIGASYGRLISSKEELVTDYYVNLDPEKYYFNKNDLNGIAGLSYELYKGLFISFRYQHSIIPIRDKERAVVGWGVDEYNHTCALRLVYLVSKSNSR
jgi:hypothetical protein